MYPQKGNLECKGEGKSVPHQNPLETYREKGTVLQGREAQKTRRPKRILSQEGSAIKKQNAFAEGGVGNKILELGTIKSIGGQRGGGGGRKQGVSKGTSKVGN